MRRIGTRTLPDAGVCGNRIVVVVVVSMGVGVLLGIQLHGAVAVMSWRDGGHADTTASSLLSLCAGMRTPSSPSSASPTPADVVVVGRRQQEEEHDAMMMMTPPSRRWVDRRLPPFPSSSSTTITRGSNATTNTTNERRNVLVVYSGPTVALPDEDQLHERRHRRLLLYHLNFRYFLRYGISCANTITTVLVVTEAVARQYRTRVEEAVRVRRRQDCGRVVLAVRNDTCLDMETVRVVVHEGRERWNVNVWDHDYFVYVNCGTTGPSRKWTTAALPSWTDVFVNKLQQPHSDIKMTGLSLNCGTNKPHIQSMMFALDRVGLDIVVHNSSAIYDCTREGPGADKKGQLIGRYEMGMSQAILDAGYAISPAVIESHMILTRRNQSTCRDDPYYMDVWVTRRMLQHFGRLLTLEETIFFKTSRILTAEIAREIGYNHSLPDNW